MGMKWLPITDRHIRLAQKHLAQAWDKEFDRGNAEARIAIREALQAIDNLLRTEEAD